MNSKLFNEYKNSDKYIIPLNSFRKPIKGAEWSKMNKLEMDTFIDNLKEYEIKKIYGTAWKLPSDIIIIDFDIKYNQNGLLINSMECFKSFIEWSKKNTYCVQTPSGGIHIYFKTNQSKFIVNHSIDKENMFHIDILKENNIIRMAGTIQNEVCGTPKCEPCYKKHGNCKIRGKTYQSINHLPIYEIDLENPPTEICQDIKTIIEINKNIIDEDENEENETKYIYEDDIWEWFIPTLKPLSEEYNTWIDTLICLYNILKDNERRNEYLHMFSKLSTKYVKQITDEKIKSFKDDKLYKTGIPTLIKLCEKYGIETNGFELIQDITILPYNKTDDTYYMNDLIIKIQSKTWKSLNLLLNYMKQNINRVILQYGKGFYIKKSKKTPLFYILKNELNENIIKYMSFEKNKPKTNSITFKKLILSHCINDIQLYDEIEFNPSNQIQPRTFNLWNGFQAKLLDNYDITKINKILQHIKSVWANNNQSHYEYILSWFHQHFKYPYQKNKVVLVFRSEKQQVGKSIITEQFLNPYVYGHELSYPCIGIDDILSRFNDDIMGKLFCSIEELPTLNGNYNPMFDKLKAIISGSKLKIEHKGGSRFNINNFLNFIMFTNNEFSIKVEKYDMRYAIFECSDIYYKKYDYFKQLADQFTQENANIFFSYIYHLDKYVQIQNLQNIPETKLRLEMQMSSISNTERFVIHLQQLNQLDENELDKDELEHYKFITSQINRVNANKLYSYYEFICKREGERAVSQTKLGRILSKYFTKIKSGLVYYDLSINPTIDS